MKSLITFFKSLTIVGKGTVVSVASLIAVIVSMKAAIIGLCILIFIDLITGIRKNHHDWGVTFNPRKPMFWKSIKSYLLRKTWQKTYEYGFGIIVVVIFENFILGMASVELMDKTFTISELAVIIPAIIEVWSIFENFEAVSGSNWLKRLQFLLPPRLRSLFTNKEVDGDINITPSEGEDVINELKR